MHAPADLPLSGASVSLASDPPHARAPCSAARVGSAARAVAAIFAHLSSAGDQATNGRTAHYTAGKWLCAG